MDAISQIGRWEISHDAALTRGLYDQWVPEICDCTDCVNFRAAIDQALTPPFRHLLAQLGIDHTKPAELCHYGEPGRPSPTQGWYHFVGKIVSGEDAWAPIDETTHSLDLGGFVGMEGVGFTNKLALVSELFKSHQIVQIEFSTVTPWVIDVPLSG